MKRLGRSLTRVSEAVLALMLAGMLGMVLLNVVMRYAFGSGFDATEELSRTLFVWLVFGGAVLAAFEGTHLGMETLLEHLPPGPRLACIIASELTVLACCVLVFWGTLRQHEVNATNKSLTTGMAMIWVYGMGYVAAGGIGVATAYRLWRAVVQAVAHTLQHVPVREIDAGAKGEALL